MELLFESRLEVASATGKVCAFQAKPTLHPEPVVRPDTPADGSGASIYGSVLRDGGKLRMWYQAWPKGWNGQDVLYVGYAESDDGVAWTKPRLGILECAGAPSNLVNLGMHCPSVFMDPQAQASHRYRATGFILPGRPGAHPQAQRRGYFTAHSADGLRWELDSREPTWEGGDVITSVWHPAQQRAMVLLKQSVRVRGVPRRSIWNAELRDGRWSPARCALMPDDFDDVAAVARGCASADYYGMGMMPAGKGAVGFLWPFRHDLPYSSSSGHGIFGHCDISLAYQAGPGERWLHMPGRPDFITHGEFPLSGGGLYSAANAIEIGDEQRLYLTCTDHSHGWYIDANWKVIEKRLSEMIAGTFARVCYASWPRDRLFGFRSDPEGQLTLALRDVEGPGELRLNYRAAPNGSVRVEILNRAGFALTDAVPLTGDQLDAPAAWSCGTLIPPDPSGNLSIRLHIEEAEVYAYELRPAHQ